MTSLQDILGPFKDPFSMNPYEMIQFTGALFKRFDQIRGLSRSSSDRALLDQAIVRSKRTVQALPYCGLCEAAQADTWAMLGIVLYYLLNPRRNQFVAGDNCPEAVDCFQRCLRIASGRSDIREYLRLLSRETGCKDAEREHKTEPNVDDSDTDGNASHLSFACTSCGKRLVASLKIAGKKTKCPKCNNIVLIPHKTTDEVSGSGDVRKAKVSGANVPREAPLATRASVPEKVGPETLDGLLAAFWEQDSKQSGRTGPQRAMPATNAASTGEPKPNPRRPSPSPTSQPSSQPARQSCVSCRQDFTGQRCWGLTCDRCPARICHRCSQLVGRCPSCGGRLLNSML
jgi:hypothetical protein